MLHICVALAGHGEPFWFRMPTEVVSRNRRDRPRWRCQFGEHGQTGFPCSTTIIGRQHGQATLADAGCAQDRRAQPPQRRLPQGPSRLQEPQARLRPLRRALTKLAATSSRATREAVIRE